MTKRALVTGACGFSASYMIDLLLKNGWEVVGTDLKTAPRSNLEKFKNIKFIPADLTDKQSLKDTVRDIDVVFHTAAIFDFSTPLELLRAVNVQGTRNLIEVSMDSNVEKVVCWSSVALYGDADPKWYSIPITEEQKPNPSCEAKYGISKREQEAAALEYYNENDFPISFIRCAAIYGPGTYYGMYTLFRFIKLGTLSILPRNLHKGSIPLVHAEDIARAGLFLSNNHKDLNGEAYIVADNNNLDLVQTCKFIAFMTDQRIKVIPPFPMKFLTPVMKLLGKWSLWEAKNIRKKGNNKLPTPKFETETVGYVFGNYWFSNEKIRNMGFNFKYGEREIGLAETIKWYDEKGWFPPFH